MKRILRNFSVLTLMLGLTFTACKKANDTNNIEPVNQEEQALRTQADEAIAYNTKEVANHSSNIKGLITSAGLNYRGNNKNIVQIAQSLPIFKSLVAAVVKCDLAGTLSTANLNATVFAPTDAAFAKLPAPFNNETNIAGITNPEQIAFLKSVLLYHVIGAKVKKSDIASGKSSAATLKTTTVANDNKVYISNNFGLLLLNGNSLVLLPDLMASNGIIHVIDDVLLFPTKNIAAVATGSADFSTLVAALVKTNLVSVFTGTGDFTVFAPTNAAFAKLPAPFNSAANINAISAQAQIDALANILKYHVVGSRNFAWDLGVLTPIETLASAPNNKVNGVLGLDMGYVKGKSNTKFSTAKPANILTTNGVVHVIDEVLLP
jgi:uncharacterized surface protein with fasciclin (FAS1) repeats